tara:strand:+ start:813 stop:1280 length:468 start_codon:yes stop_codon:yes gene_type:complete
MIDMPDNWKQAEVRVYLPKYIKYPDIFLQSKINNYNNIFDGCFGHTKIQSSDIDGIYHLSHRGSENSSKDVFVIIESKIGDSFNGGQEILAKSITSDPRFYYMVLFFEKEDKLQQNPYAYSLIKNSEYLKTNQIIKDKSILKKWMKGLSKKQNII